MGLELKGFPEQAEFIIMVTLFGGINVSMTFLNICLWLHSPEEWCKYEKENAGDCKEKGEKYKRWSETCHEILCDSVV